MTNQLAGARRTLERLLDCYLVRRDVEGALACASDDIYCVGTGMFEIATDKRELRELFQGEMERDPRSFTYVLETMSEKCFSDGCAIFCTVLRARQERGDRTAAQTLLVRLTAVVRGQDEDFQVCALHMSNGVDNRTEQEFCPSLEQDRLPRLVRDQSVRLLNGSLSEGMIGCYLDEGLPLHLINDAMLHLLDYTYDQLVAQTGGLLVNCVHPDDREHVRVVVGRGIANACEYEVIYRMEKRDGRFLWVLDRGRGITDMAGRPASISACFDITDSVNLQDALEEKTKRLLEKDRELEQVYNTVFSGVAKVSDDGRCSFIFANERYYQMLGYEREEYLRLVRRDPLMTVHPQDTAQMLEMIEAIREQGHGRSLTLRLRKKDGAVIWVRIDASLSEERYGGYRIFYLVYTDIDEQREREEERRKQQQFTSLILRSNTVGTLILNNDERYSFVYIGDNLAAFLGYEQEEFLRRFPDACSMIYFEDAKSALEMIRSQLSISDYYEVEYRVQKRDGSLVWMLEKGSRTLGEQGEEILISILLDNSRQRQVKDGLTRASKLDPLTRIYNRAAARDEIDRQLREGEHGAALFLLDVDDFKKINDCYGHLEGDNVLMGLAGLLARSFRDEDVVARLGGDEFFVFLRGVRSQALPRAKARYLCDAFQESGLDSHPTISVGVAVSLSGQTGFTELYRAADVALYRAKCAGKNSFEVETLSDGGP